jgi:DNA-3-methyladenine glycosylase I
MELIRCGWAANERLTRYHDLEWGVPQHDEARLFEFLVLEGAQAGLSWETVLRKREAYRLAFDGFDPERIARYDDAQVARLLADASIIRNRAKIASAIGNARATLALRQEPGGLDAYLWRFVGGAPRRNAWRTGEQVPASTPESDALSRDLRRRGFTFVGTTICYSLMQAVGMVNDHLVTCFRHAEIEG